MGNGTGSSAAAPTEIDVRAAAEHHIEMVRQSASKREWTYEAWILLRSIMEDDKYNRGVFNEPVDDRYVIGYYNIICNPMDFGTIKGRLEDGFYSNLEAFVEEMQLVFANATVFNAADHAVHKAAKQLKTIFETKLSQVKQKMANEAGKRAGHSCERCHGHKCAVCLKGCLEFSPPDIRCSPPCRSRIPRGGTYHRLGGDRGQHWCQRCYSNLSDEFIGLLGQRVLKRDLEQCVNSMIFREPWIKCSHCQRWSHMICTFYTRGWRKPSDSTNSVPENVENAPDEFYCVLCVAEQRTLKIEWPCASSLPECEMSTFLQMRVREAAITELIKPPLNGGSSLLSPQLTLSEAEEISKTLIVRVVSCLRSDGVMESRIRKWVETQCFVANRLPGEVLMRFPHVSKAICVFQETSSQEVMLGFTLYVQEYGLECSPQSANRGAVYISYLDSVPFIKPRRLRSIVYQEVMLAYLAWVRQRGFNRCYIWACPPQKGDAYVMNCHPQWQRNPSAERLRRWYGSIFNQCHQEGLLTSNTTMFDLHLAKYKPIIHTRRSVLAENTQVKDFVRHVGRFELEKLPYFLGDFVFTELELVLAELEQANGDLTETRMREWWRVVWGPNATIELVREQGARDDGLLFDPSGLPYPGTFVVVRPSVPTPNMETLMRLERECCTVTERDEWIMRKISGAVRPQKDNFFVLLFSPARPDSPTQGTTAFPESPAVKRQKKEVASHGSPRRTPPPSHLGGLVDPDPLLPRTCFDSRLCYLDLCVVNHLQFNTYHHARFATAVTLDFLKQNFEASRKQ